MKYFLDTEFIEAPGHLDLISIGIRCESGESLYCENSEVDWSRSSQWVLDNVKPHLTGHNTTKAQIAAAVTEFVRDNDDGSPVEFWGYYCDYDWVALCWLFGTMMDLPKGFPYFCRDLRQALDDRGLQHIKQPDDAPHHALQDAWWIEATHRQHVRPAPTLQENENG
jgi:hypothetical protein